MKFARMSKVLLSAVLSSLVLATAAAAAEPLRATIGNGGDAVASGTDIFWTSSRKIKPMPREGYSYETSLMRTSFVNAANVLVKKFDPKDTALGFPSDFVIGGDFIYVTMEGDGLDSGGASTTILRMRRDGSDPQTVTQGKLTSSEENSTILRKGKVYLNDCGTSVAAELATSDGGVVIQETIAERDSKACGRKKNTDRHRYYLLSPTGVIREIASEKLRVSSKFKVEKDGSYEGSSSAGSRNLMIAQAIGDRVLIERFRGKKSRYFVRDLNTGIDSDPYVVAGNGLDPFNLGSMDPAGRVAITRLALRGTKKRPTVDFVSGVFPVAGDASNFLRAKGQAIFQFCGNHLVAETMKGIRELDPLTLNLLRPIAPLPPVRFVTDTCDGDYLYAMRQKGRSAEYLAYPLN